MACPNHLRRDPFIELTAPKVPRLAHRNLEPDDAALLIAACIDSTERLVVILGLQLGLRRAEISLLEVGDLRLRAGEVLVHGKGGHADTIPLTEHATLAVKAYMADKAITAGPLLRGIANPAVGKSPESVGRIFADVAYRAGLKRQPHDGVSTHALRHTAATDVYRRTKDLKAVQKMLRHRSIATTEIYIADVDMDELREAMEGRPYGRAA